MSTDALRVIEGTIASDGTLIPYPSKTMFRKARFQIDLGGEANIDWLEHIKEALIELGIHVSDRYPKVVRETYTYSCLYSARSYSLFTLYKKWYPLGIKEIPPGFELTPCFLANLFMGDGTSAKSSMKLCTQGFSRDSIGKLCIGLAALNVPARVYLADNKRQGQWEVWVTNATSLNRFYDIVEPYILPSFGYKIKRPSLERLKLPGGGMKLGEFVWDNGNWRSTQ